MMYRYILKEKEGMFDERFLEIISPRIDPTVYNRRQELTDLTKRVHNLNRRSKAFHRSRQEMLREITEVKQGVATARAYADEYAKDPLLQVALLILNHYDQCDQIQQSAESIKRDLMWSLPQS